MTGPRLPTIDLVQDVILDLLGREGRALSRPFIEASVVDRTDCAPWKVMDALDRLFKGNRIRKTALAYTGSLGIEAVLYSLEEPDAFEISRYEDLFLRKHRLNGEVGMAGERYFRAILVRARVYREIPQIQRMGHLQCGKYEADVTAVRRDCPEIGLIVFEVKNERQTFYPASPIFGKLINTCLRKDLSQPALAVVRLSAEARQYCERWGIAYLEFQRQLYPAHVRDEVLALSDVIGPNRYVFVNPARPLHHGPSIYASRHIEIVRNPSWLRMANATWRRQYHLAEEYGWRLEHKPSADLVREVLGRLQHAA